MTTPTPSSVVKVSISSEREYAVDMLALREDYPTEAAGFTDDVAFARDAWDNGIREPYFKLVDEFADEQVWRTL